LRHIVDPKSESIAPLPYCTSQLWLAVWSLLFRDISRKLPFHFILCVFFNFPISF